MSKDRRDKLANFKKMKDINLDKVLDIKENREPNNFGLYRMNCLIIGKTGSGKTTVLLKALLTDAIDDFKLLLIIVPRESLESGFYESLYNKLKNSKDQKINGKYFMFCIIGEEDLPSIAQLNKISKQVKGKIAVILDDFINAFQANEWLLFKRYVTQLSRVQYGASLFALTQNLLQFPTTYRKNFNVFVLFCNSLTVLQFKDIMRSYYDYSDFTKEELEVLFNTFKRESHEPVWLINSNDADESMIWKGTYINPEKIFKDELSENERSEDIGETERSETDSSDDDHK